MSKDDKISLFQKTLLVRWINTLDISKELLTVHNIIEEIKTGVLICELLNFHSPKLDLLNGLNYKAISKKPCLNNIEKGLQVLFHKGAPSRYIPTAEEVFEADKNPQRIWVLLKVIFDMFAMSDVNKLTPYILKWISMSLQFFGPQMKHKSDMVQNILTKITSNE